MKHNLEILRNVIDEELSHECQMDDTCDRCNLFKLVVQTQLNELLEGSQTAIMKHFTSDEAPEVRVHNVDFYNTIRLINQAILIGIKYAQAIEQVELLEFMQRQT
jgi:hypothetical protein